MPFFPVFQSRTRFKSCAVSRYRPLFSLAAASVLLLPGAAKAQVRGGINEGLEMMARVEALPLLYPPGTLTRQFASQDKTGKNLDGARESFVKYTDSTQNGKEYVIFDAYGPGCLYRHHLNVWVGGLKKGTIRYYFDDDPKPRLQAEIDSLFSGRVQPVAPFAFKATSHYRGNEHFGLHYYPMPYRKRLKVTVTSPTGLISDPTLYYGGLTYQTYPQGTPIVSWDGREGPVAPVLSQWARMGQDPKPDAGNIPVTVNLVLKAGETGTAAALTGEGSLSSLRFELDAFDPRQVAALRLRLTWDDAKEPAVDLPFHRFFGGFHPDSMAKPKGDSVVNLLFGYRKASKSFFCYWPMPFWKKAKVEIVNGGDKAVTVTGEIRHKPASAQKYAEGTAGHFHAAYRESGDSVRKVLFYTRGRGHLAGRIYHSWNIAKVSMEGDEKTYFDGCRSPFMHGNGTEDDLNQGWGGSRYFKPLWGAQTTGFEDAWRIYLNDNYVFNRELEMTNEGTFGPSSSTLFYYLSPGGENLKATDSLDVGTAADETAHGYAVTGGLWKKSLKDFYDGFMNRPKFDSLIDSGRAHNGKSQFTLKIDPKNQGVKLRKRMNVAGNGLQTVKVSVDGREMEMPWHVVVNESNRWDANFPYQGWYESDYEIPSSVTNGKSQITVEMAYMRGSAKEVNEFKYWAFSHGPVPAAPTRLEGRGFHGASAKAAKQRKAEFEGRGSVLLGEGFDGKGSRRGR